MCNANNYLYNRAFQLALEVTYNKRYFQQTELEHVFREQIMFQNSIETFNHATECDQSTLFNALQSAYIKKEHPLWSITVNTTPPANIDITALSQKIQDTVRVNKLLIENSFPDISIDGVTYNFKSTKNPSNTKNQVYIVLYILEGCKVFNRHLENLSTILSRKDIRATFSTEYYNNLEHTLYKIRAEYAKASTFQQKKEINTFWNNFVITTAPQRPKDFAIPLYKLVESKIDLLPQENDLFIPEGRLDYTTTKKVLVAIVGGYTPNLQEVIHKATKGSLGHIFDTNDIHTICLFLH